MVSARPHAPHQARVVDARQLTITQVADLDVHAVRAERTHVRLGEQVFRCEHFLLHQCQAPTVEAVTQVVDVFDHLILIQEFK